MLTIKSSMAKIPNFYCLQFHFLSKWKNILYWTSWIWIYPLVNQHNYGKSPFLVGKSTISMVIFNSKLLKLPEGKHGWTIDSPGKMVSFCPYFSIDMFVAWHPHHILTGLRWLVRMRRVRPHRARGQHGTATPGVNPEAKRWSKQFMQVIYIYIHWLMVSTTLKNI